MKKITWRKHHKWLGLLLGFFIIMFSLSGLILNHPMLFADVNISRKMLPEVYQYIVCNAWLRHYERGHRRAEQGV